MEDRGEIEQGQIDGDKGEIEQGRWMEREERQRRDIDLSPLYLSSISPFIYIYISLFLNLYPSIYPRSISPLSLLYLSSISSISHLYLLSLHPSISTLTLLYLSSIYPYSPSIFPCSICPLSLSIYLHPSIPALSLPSLSLSLHISLSIFHPLDLSSISPLFILNNHPSIPALPGHEREQVLRCWYILRCKAHVRSSALSWVQL